MEKRSLVDVKAKQDDLDKRLKLKNVKSAQEITLVELSASDVEVLDEGSLDGEDIKMDEVYRNEKAKRGNGEVLIRKGDLGVGNCKDRFSKPGAAVREGIVERRRRRNGAQVDFEKMLKSRRKESLDSGELGSSLVNKCSFGEKPVAQREGGERKICISSSLKRKRGAVEVQAEDSGYISKVDGSEEEDVMVVDLCCSSKSSSQGSASSNEGDSSVELVGEVGLPLMII